MEAVIEEQEQGWGAAGDATIADPNPLAQVGGIQKPVQPYNAEFNPNGNEKIKDIANVGIEKFKERFEYGQQYGQRDDGGDVL